MYFSIIIIIPCSSSILLACLLSHYFFISLFFIFGCLCHLLFYTLVWSLSWLAAGSLFGEETKLAVHWFNLRWQNKNSSPVCILGTFGELFFCSFVLFKGGQQSVAILCHISKFTLGRSNGKCETKNHTDRSPKWFLFYVYDMNPAELFLIILSLSLSFVTWWSLSDKSGSEWASRDTSTSWCVMEWNSSLVICNQRGDPSKLMINDFVTFLLMRWVRKVRHGRKWWFWWKLTWKVTK